MGRKAVKSSCILLLILILSAFFYSCHSKGEEDQENVSAGTPVKVVHPANTNMEDYLRLSGTTAFLKKEIVRAPFQGYISKTLKSLGDPVKKNDILFLLQTKESYAVNNINEKDDKVNDLSVPIRAKSDGILTQLNYYSGEYVSDGEQIASIAISNSLVVMLNVPYQDVSKIKVGEKCELLLPDKRTVNGIISRSIPQVDSITQTQTYLISINDKSSLPENLNVSVKIPVRNVVNATVVPKNSILSNETLNNFWVMKLINDTTAVRVDVKKGIENDSLVQIIDPKLNSSDKIISEGGYGLPDTAKVIIGNK